MHNNECGWGCDRVSVCQRVGSLSLSLALCLEGAGTVMYGGWILLNVYVCMTTAVTAAKSKILRHPESTLRAATDMYMYT